MSQIALNRVLEQERTTTDWQRLMQLGGAAVIVQMACMVIGLITGIVFGAEPETAAEAFAMFQDDRLTGILRLDFATLVLLCLMPLTAIGVYAGMRHRPAYALLLLALVLLGTALGLANQSALSIVGLFDRYVAATSPAGQAQLLAAGDAILAGNMWQGTAGFLAGLFMQGGFVFISIVMLQGSRFGRATAYSGLLANGLDLIHVPLLLFAPTLSFVFLAASGVFYAVWFPLLARDLLRQARTAE